MMKKIIMILSVLLIAMPAMAAVDLSLTDNGDGTVTVGYDASGESSLPRAFALVVTTDGTFGTVTPAHAGINDATNQGFGIFPGTILIQSGAITDNGTPVAPAGDPGTDVANYGTKVLILEMGSLYEDANAPADNGDLATIAVSGATEVSVDIEPIRGGVILEDGTSTSDTLVVNGDTLDMATVCAGDLNGDQMITTVDMGMLYNILGAAGAPYQVSPSDASWNDGGDLNGDQMITTVDMGMLYNILGAAGAPYQVPCQ